MNMTVYTLDVQDMSKQANTIKEVVLYGLEKEGFLQKGQADSIGEKYAVVLYKRGWFGQLWDKWMDGIQPSAFRITFVKIIT